MTFEFTARNKINHGYSLSFPLYLHAGSGISLNDGSDIKLFISFGKCGSIRLGFTELLIKFRENDLRACVRVCEHYICQ